MPEFSVKYFDNSYDYYVPPVTTNSTDPYTGNVTVTIVPGYIQHVDNKSIQITIKNQPYQFSYNGTNYYLYYNVRVKGHYGESWKEVFYSSSKFDNPYPSPSASEYTVLHMWANEYPSDSVLDIQVNALVGYTAVEWIQRYIQGPYGDYKSVFHIGQSSGWSSSQTLTIPETSPSTTNMPTTPTESQTPSESLTPLPAPTNSAATQTVPTTPFASLAPSASAQSVVGVSQSEFYSVVDALVAVITGLIVAVAVLAIKVNKNKR